jgi:hypothetical protein
MATTDTVHFENDLNSRVLHSIGIFIFQPVAKADMIMTPPQYAENSLTL